MRARVADASTKDTLTSETRGLSRAGCRRVGRVRASALLRGDASVVLFACGAAAGAQREAVFRQVCAPFLLRLGARTAVCWVFPDGARPALPPCSCPPWAACWVAGACPRISARPCLWSLGPSLPGPHTISTRCPGLLPCGVHSPAGAPFPGDVACPPPAPLYLPRTLSPSGPRRPERCRSPWPSPAALLHLLRPSDHLTPKRLSEPESRRAHLFLPLPSPVARTAAPGARLSPGCPPFSAPGWPAAPPWAVGVSRVLPCQSAPKTLNSWRAGSCPLFSSCVPGVLVAPG